MFGHNDQHHDTTLPAPASDDANDNGAAPATAPQIDSSSDFPDDVSAPSTPPTVTRPDAPVADVGLGDESAATAPSAAPATIPEPTAAAPTAPDTNNLLDIKQQALQQLTPLIGHLEQSPEEKFRTTMMMIQAADNQALIQAAYEAAQQIEDEKTRAQALLDIVNEINYFTHNKTTEAAVA